MNYYLQNKTNDIIRFYQYDGFRLKNNLKKDNYPLEPFLNW